MRPHTKEEKQKLSRITQVIHNLRTLSGISQRKLAEISGVHPDTIVRVENGEYYYSLPILLKLADALDTTLASIFEESDL